MVLGIEDSSTYASYSIQFPPDHMLIAYTDGVTEAEASPGIFYGINQLLELSTMISPWSSSRAIEQICNAVDAFSNGHLKDDRTIVVLHRSAGK
jgi:serine phosphatase RsbU (regulator of sigma subunit)